MQEPIENSMKTVKFDLETNGEIKKAQTSKEGSSIVAPLALNPSKTKALRRQLRKKS
jgi:hypothetical protein